MKLPFRFSLLGLFAVVTIVALAVSLYLAQSRLAVAQAEVQQLRRETGHLTIDDPQQVHVIAVPTTDAMHWRWRIYLPGGHDFGVYAHRGKFDKRGFPVRGVLASQSRMGGQSDPNLAREIILDVALDKTNEGNASLRIRENGNGGERKGVRNRYCQKWRKGSNRFLTPFLPSMASGESSDLIRPADDVYCWLEQDSSIMLKAITKFGDPVELAAVEARSIASALLALAERLEPGGDSTA